MSDYNATRSAATQVTGRLNLTLDTDELGIWLVDETPEGPQQLGHISWREITRGVQEDRQRRSAKGE
jgi:hypothetical protein